ncbi:foldase protein PrsA [Paenibacillus macquariensis]|uniref:peptidylprolyl isomerase n=2 Tax=Paenibacillus macquariensis TaxID=948756 RepID=A0ABY1KCK0_9BACL|nr:foldase protein PrsA [Paenibacillus macquariensis]
MTRIKREKRTLWVVNIILTMGFLFMGCLIMFRGLGPVDEESKLPDGELSVAYFKKEPISNSEWEQELKRKYGQEVLLHMLNRKAVFEEANVRDIHITSDEVNRQLKKDMMGYDSVKSYYDEMETQLGLSPEDVAEEMSYRLTLEQIATADIHISDEDIDNYREENEDQFEARKQFQLSVIKVASQGEAEDVLDQLEKGANFTEMVKEHSIDVSSRDQEGKIAPVESDDPFLPKEMLDAVALLQINDISGPFQWDKDYVVIQLMDIIIEEQEDTQHIRESIRKRLALNEAMPLTELEKLLRDKYEVRIVAFNGL